MGRSSWSPGTAARQLRVEVNHGLESIHTVAGGFENVCAIDVHNQSGEMAASERELSALLLQEGSRNG